MIHDIFYVRVELEMLHLKRYIVEYIYIDKEYDKYTIWYCDNYGNKGLVNNKFITFISKLDIDKIKDKKRENGYNSSEGYYETEEGVIKIFNWIKTLLFLRKV